MAKKETNLTYTFIDPNTPEAFAEALKKILIDKLLSLHKSETFAAC